jgi:CBS domain-containing protein
MTTGSRKPHSNDVVRFAMSSPVVALAPDATLRAAAGVLRSHDIGAVAVVADDGLVGVLSERDLVRSVADGTDPDQATIREAMTGSPRPIEADSPLWAATMLMLGCGVRHLPVTENGLVVGMLSIREALAVMESDRLIEPHSTIDTVDPHRLPV